MTDKQKGNRGRSHDCCEGVDFAGMMEAMMSQKEELCGCGCMETMKKMTPKFSQPQNQESETND